MAVVVDTKTGNRRKEAADERPKAVKARQTEEEDRKAEEDPQDS